MKYIIILLSLTLSSGAFCQIIETNNYKAIEEQAKYKGKLIYLNKTNILRFKTYSRTYIQSTYIRQFKQYDIRIYVYYDILKHVFTPAVSLRFFIMPKKLH